MTNPGDFKPQLTNLTAELCGMIAEKLHHSINHLNKQEQKPFLDLLEYQLPALVSNTIAKTPSLHSSAGVEYMEKNLEDWAEDWCKKILNRG